MYIQTAKGDYAIHFRHKTEYFGIGTRRYTVCTVHLNKCTKDDCEEGWQGAAYVHPNDNFCRATGRKIALTRAIKEFQKPVRAAIWQAYLGSKQQAA